MSFLIGYGWTTGLPGVSTRHASKINQYVRHYVQGLKHPSFVVPACSSECCLSTECDRGRRDMSRVGASSSDITYLTPNEFDEAIKKVT